MLSLWMLGSHSLSWIWGTFWSAEQGYILAASLNGQRAPDSPLQGLSPLYILILAHCSFPVGDSWFAVAFYAIREAQEYSLLSLCCIFLQGKTGMRSADCFVFLFLLVYAGIYCLGHQHPAHPHIWLVKGLWWEPIQVLPASHLHSHAACPMYCDPSKSCLQFALHSAETHANQKRLGEGEVRQVCPAQCNRGVFEWGDL